MHRSKKLTILVVGAVAALALGSFAFGAIPDGGGVIHGCYEKESGKLRVTDAATGTPKACTSKELALDWNQQGPKGDRGPSNAYWGEDLFTLVPAHDSFSTVVATTPDLAPGRYVVSAKVVAYPSGLNVPPTIVHCQLGISSPNGGTADYAYGTVSSNASGPVIVSTLSLENDNTDILVSNGGKASVRCDGPIAFQARDTNITAIQVESLTY